MPSLIIVVKLHIKTNFGIPLITAKIVKSGRTEKPEEFISEEDYIEWMQRGYPEKGDIVFTTEAPLGEVAQLKSEKVALAQRIITLRGKRDRLNNNYLLYALQSDYVRDQILSRATGTTVIGIKQTELRKVILPLPPLPEQRAIAEILSSLDDRIELNNRMNRTLESMAQAIFKQWFVDFEFPKSPLRPGEGGPLAVGEVTYKSSGGRMVDSELGMIPEGWRVGKLPEMIEINARR
jgi:type I restriction enzyme S subunit